MDSSLLKTLLSSATSIAKETKSTDKDVKSVLTSALPFMMAGKKPTAEQNKTVAKETGLDAGLVGKIVTAALPYVKEALKNVDTKKVAAVASKVATPENMKKAADIAGKLLKKK